MELWEDSKRSKPKLVWEGVLMCSRGSWGDNKLLEEGLNEGVSCRDSEGVKGRVEKEPGCW